MPEKKISTEPGKSWVGEHIKALGAIAGGILAILSLLFIFFPDLRPKGRSDTQKVDFASEMSAQRLREYLSKINISESAALGSSGSSGTRIASNGRSPGFSPKANAGQIKGLNRTFLPEEIAAPGFLVKVPMRFSGTEDKKYYLHWSLNDENNTEVYNSERDFRYEIKTEHRGGDDTAAYVWIPTAGRVGTFNVRAEIFDEQKNSLSVSKPLKLTLP